MFKRLLVLAAGVAAVVAVRRSVQQQRAERDLWAEATDVPAPQTPAAPAAPPASAAPAAPGAPQDAASPPPAAPSQ